MTTPAPHPPAPPPHQPSFARRHPILTGFGVFAGLSLFAAYFPISAIVTAVIVGAHATGADRAGLRIGERAGCWLRSRLPHRAPDPVSASPPAPAAPSLSQPVQRETTALQRSAHALHQREHQQREQRRSPSRRQEPAAPAAARRGAGSELER
jgi:hypothetical protein